MNRRAWGRAVDSSWPWQPARRIAPTNDAAGARPSSDHLPTRTEAGRSATSRPAKLAFFWFRVVRWACAAAMLVGVGVGPRGWAAGSDAASGKTPSRASSGEPVVAWKHFADVPAAPGKAALVDFVVPAAVFDVARMDLGDLRLRDAAGRDVPYALRILNEVDTTEVVPTHEFNRVPGPAGASRLTLDLGAKAIEHNEVEIQTPGKNFRRRVVLEGSDDDNTWSQLTEREVVRFPVEPEPFVVKTLTYTPSRHRYLRMTVDRDPQHDAEAIAIGPVIVRRRVKLPGELDVRRVPFGDREATRAEGGPGSRWIIDLQGRDVPVDRLLVTVGDDEFARNYVIEAGGPVESSERFTYVASGLWQRRAGEPPRELIAEFTGEVRATRLRLTITDNENPPLRLESVRAAAAARVVIARRADAAAEVRRLYYGNPKAEPPNYDFARNLPERLVPPPDRAQLGAPHENPTYQPEPLPLTERLPWLIYVLLSAAVCVLAVLIANLARAAIRVADRSEAAVESGS